MTAGSVDDGKSTLIGRLLVETGSVYRDHLEEARRATTNASVLEAGEAVDYSLLTDGLAAEREQGITIDVAWRTFATPRRAFALADAPGHEQYTRNMATGASRADVALLLVDARKGVVEQTRRHAFVAALLGVRHVVVVVNKMDLVGWDEAAFARVREEFGAFAARLELPDVRFVAVSALRGDNVVAPVGRAWAGPPLLETLETLYVDSDRNLVDLRLPVQLVLRPDQDLRACAGQLASGVLRPGDEVLALPSGRRARVRRLVGWGADRAEAFAPQSVAVVLEDDVDVGRGEVLCHPNNQPLVAERLEAMVVWFDEAPLEAGATVLLKLQAQTVRARVEEVRYELDVDTLRRRLDRPALARHAVGRVVLRAQRPLVFDPYRKNRATGALIFIDPRTQATAGAGTIIDRLPVHAAAQGARTVWLTAASDEVAAEVARRLDARGGPVHLLGAHLLADAAAAARALNDAGVTCVVRAAQVEDSPLLAGRLVVVDATTVAAILAALG